MGLRGGLSARFVGHLPPTGCGPRPGAGYGASGGVLEPRGHRVLPIAHVIAHGRRVVVEEEAIGS